MLSKLHVGLKVIAGFLLLIVGGILALPGAPDPALWSSFSDCGC
jgi:hypothetical protein